MPSWAKESILFVPGRTVAVGTPAPRCGGGVVGVSIPLADRFLSRTIGFAIFFSSRAKPGRRRGHVLSPALAQASQMPFNFWRLVMA